MSDRCKCKSTNIVSVPVRKEDLRAFIAGEDVAPPHAWDTGIVIVKLCDDCKSIIDGQKWITKDD